jgi:hypothetical protein
LKWKAANAGIREESKKKEKEGRKERDVGGKENGECSRKTGKQEESMSCTV